jgi:hypothetical protein
MGFGTSHVYRSIDGGDSWIDFGARLPDVPASAIAIDPDRPSVVYVGTDLGVYVSPHHHLGWFAFTAGMPPASVNDLVIARPAGKVRAATHGNGVYERAVLPLAITGPGEAPPAGPLLVVTPNPLRAAGRIAFTLSEPSRVRLALYDVAGREVVLLEDGGRPAGTHTVRLDAAGLGRGVYFVKLETAEGDAVSRVVFLQ